MKNAFKYGAFIGIASGVWILVLHFAGVYESQFPKADQPSWLEYVSGIIPVTGLYLGIKNFRNRVNGGRMEFFEGIFEGFKIMIVGGIIASFFASVYVTYVIKGLQTDYMARVGAAGVIGILSTLVISLLLMNKQHNL
ncbi:DUF4199 domain-containing protein [Desertivirga xinjiangensis]|uniref:DUF4199 domain-containing protein n=1 Tax=Desertivirga xinjiangensis TaxID=539206 RepID=UPI00210B2F88|nr:DUF4199 domain-containing protein [Pedobacter xinjiangensis]